MVFKCKMCGGDLDIPEENLTVCECSYCGTKQTIPSLDNEKKLTLFNRANSLRFRSEFDKAAGVYEAIVEGFPEEAEGYWGLVLCKYGIEYVDDPATNKKIPTCHRSSFDSVMDDSDFEMVMENSDPVSRKIYRDEAKAIEELRKSIVAVSSTEEPYDIFICYKETDENGERTIDSVIAQDVYDALTEKGYRVFFARITLETILGKEYEPYIFAALNSAKIMLAFGTDYEYYNAVWVKNEWSRFLKLIEKGDKKTIIPCYKNIDAYDLPKEFAKLQAQDMGKVGAIQDLLRGIEKILPSKKKVEPVVQHTVVSEVPDAKINPVVPLLKRAEIFLEDGDLRSTVEYCEKVLDIAPEHPQPYLIKLLVDCGVKKVQDLESVNVQFENNLNCQKFIRYGGENARKLIENIVAKRQMNVTFSEDYKDARRLIEIGEVWACERAKQKLSKVYQNQEVTLLIAECDRIIQEKKEEEKQRDSALKIIGVSIFVASVLLILLFMFGLL